MTRMTFFSLAAVAMLGTACERHSASELASEPGAALQAPAEVPQNPAGAGPVSTEEKHVGGEVPKEGAPNEAAPAAVSATPAPKGSAFFPSNK